MQEILMSTSSFLDNVVDIYLNMKDATGMTSEPKSVKVFADKDGKAFWGTDFVLATAKEHPKDAVRQFSTPDFPNLSLIAEIYPEPHNTREKLQQTVNELTADYKQNRTRPIFQTYDAV
jgi:hypothetical protein